MNDQLLDNIKIYYGETLTSNSDLRTDACCTPDAVPEQVRELMTDIHPEVSNRYYGCGLVAPDALDGLRILDLGSGSGRDVFLLSKLVGEHGHVVGVDMTPEQLHVARKHIDYHRDRFGYTRSNVEFLEGRIEQLDQLGLDTGSFDLVVSNCVINLSPDKPAVLEQVHTLLREGGEMYFSDVYADRRLPDELMRDPVLHGECLAGALYWNDFLVLARNAGFDDPRLVEDRPLAVSDPAIAAMLAPASFYSATFRLFKLPGLDAGHEDYGQAVAYRGSLSSHPATWELDKQHPFVTGKVTEVCRNSYRMLSESRLRSHFEFYGDAGRHLGQFDDGTRHMPFDDQRQVEPASEGNCGC